MFRIAADEDGYAVYALSTLVERFASLESAQACVEELARELAM